MPNITLREYEETLYNGLLESWQLARLRDARVDVYQETADGTTWTLKPSSFVGVLNLGYLSVVIRPKIPVDRVIFLVAYAMDPKGWRSLVSDLLPDQDILESIVPALVHHVRQGIKRGLLQGYRREEDSLRTVKGRIRFQDQLTRRYGVALPLELTYDEFTEDIEENRLLKGALYRLSRFPMRFPESRRQVASLRPVFNNVELTNYPRGSPSIKYTRLNEHYRPAVELARLIVDNSSLELLHGKVAGTSFLLDMNRIFERFLFVSLQEALGLTGRQWKKCKLTLDEADVIKLEPDLSWWDSGRCCFVGDAKYKETGILGFEHADIYQMLAYCTATKLPAGLLVYAAGGAGPGLHRIKHTEKSIEVTTVDLSGTPQMILNDVQGIATKVRNMAGM